MSENAVDAIRARMARIRSRASGKADQLGEEIPRFFDWKNYVRAFPWWTLAGGLAVGYLVVPRRLYVDQPDPKTIAALAKKNRLVVAPDRKEYTRSPSLIDTAFNLVANSVLRAGVAYAGQELGKLLAPASSDAHDLRDREHEYHRSSV
jgi:hypothetical protein